MVTGYGCPVAPTQIKSLVHVTIIQDDGTWTILTQKYGGCKLQVTPSWLQTLFRVVKSNFFSVGVKRQCGPVVRALALISGDPGFKTRSDHSLLGCRMAIPV